jgi:hypothetical protein
MKIKRTTDEKSLFVYTFIVFSYGQMPGKQFFDKQ